MPPVAQSTARLVTNGEQKMTPKCPLLPTQSQNGRPKKCLSHCGRNFGIIALRFTLQLVDGALTFGRI